MSSVPLDAALAKWERASEHLEALQSETSQFLHRHPYRVVVKTDAESDWQTAVLEIAEEPPIRLGVLAGEFAYQCLSGLNQLVWELSSRKLGRKKVLAHRHSVQFPVAGSAGHFKKLALIKDRLVSREAVTKLEGLQPYHGRDGPKGHPLGSIKRIADFDKHRRLALGFSAIGFEDLSFAWREDGPVPEFESLLSAAGSSLDNGAEIARFRFPHPGGSVYVDGEPSGEVHFGMGDWGFTLRHLERCLGWVRHLAQPTLTPLFE